MAQPSPDARPLTPLGVTGAVGVLLASGAALLAAAASSPLVLRLLRSRVVDVPGERSSHVEPTPRGGGIVIAAGLGAGLLVLADWSDPLFGALLVALLLGAVGLAEDVRGIAVGPRLLLQAAGAAAALLWMLADWTGAGWWLVVFGAGCLFWIVGFTNIFNFMDGINGIAGAQLAVAGAAFFVIGATEDLDLLRNLGAITAAAAAGFLPWNFPAARFFMGDVGSYFSGAWLAAVAILAMRLDVAPVAAIAPLLIFCGDATLTLVSRIGAGEVWHQPHRSHVYQRLVVGGWSHTRTTGFYSVVATAVSALGLLALAGPAGATVAVLGSLAVFALYATAPRWS